MARRNASTTGPGAYQATEAILYVDVVESVRHMERNEIETIQRWRALFERARDEAVVGNRGRLVKHTGDGLMAVFPSSAAAVRSALAIQSFAAADNEGRADIDAMFVRIGINVGEVTADDIDVYGRSVNVAARLATLAGPGEIVISPAVRDQISDQIDAEIEDLGQCYLKHLSEPVRAYRAGPAGRHPVIEPGGGSSLLMRPTIAVIPPACRTVDPADVVIGEVIADEVIATLSRNPDLNVISRLSTTVLRDRGMDVIEIGGRLGAPYVLAGSYAGWASGYRLFLELSDARDAKVIWARTLAIKPEELFAAGNDLFMSLAADIAACICSSEIRRAMTQPLPNLESYALLVGAVGLMHRLDARGFERAHALLETLIERAPRQAIPYAWLAKWHVLRVQQGWSDNAAEDGRKALDATRRALDQDGECSLALAVDGLVHTNLLKKFDAAELSYEHALRANPSDSLALLLFGTLRAFQGRGAEAVECTEAALRLSPLDPLKYFYDSLAATAAMSAGQYDRAIELGRRSLKANRTHTSTFRAMAIAQSLKGDLDGARATVKELMRYEPELTVKGYLERNPSSMFDTGRQWADALRQAGVPER